jgi:hypothetical protein
VFLAQEFSIDRVLEWTIMQNLFSSAMRVAGILEVNGLRIGFSGIF